MQSDSDYCSFCKKCTFLAEDRSQGTIVCQKCGLVVEDKLIDFTEEYRKFGDDPNLNKQRVGGITNHLCKDYLSLDVIGGSSTSTVTKMTLRLGLKQNDRTLMTGLALLKKWGSLLSLQKDILNTAEQILSKIEQNLKGRSIETIMAAILYISMKIHLVPVKPHELESAIGIAFSDIKQAYKNVKDHVDYIPPADAPKYCFKFCAKLDASFEFSSKAIKTAEAIKKEGHLEGKKPTTIASVAIYIIMMRTPGCGFTLKDISKVADVAESTTKNAYKQLAKNLDTIIPK